MDRGAWRATVHGVAKNNQTTVLQSLDLGLFHQQGRQSLPLAKHQSGKFHRNVCGNHCPFLSFRFPTLLLCLACTLSLEVGDIFKGV